MIIMLLFLNTCMFSCVKEGNPNICATNNQKVRTYDRAKVYIQKNQLWNFVCKHALISIPVNI